jgi:hypothetical protein
VRLVDSPCNYPRRIPHCHRSSPHPACERSSCKPRWIPHSTIADSAAKNWLTKKGGPGARGPEEVGSVRLSRPRRSATCHWPRQKWPDNVLRHGVFPEIPSRRDAGISGLNIPHFYAVRSRVRLFATMPRSSVISRSSISKPAHLNARRITSRTVVRSKTALIRTACCT